MATVPGAAAAAAAGGAAAAAARAAAWERGHLVTHADAPACLVAAAYR